MDRRPQSGEFINSSDTEMIYEAVKQRQTNFLGEPLVLSMSLVLMNIGNRFTPVECLEQEWNGLIIDVEKTDGDPKCPNGHTLRKGAPLKLAWLSAE